MNDLSANPTRGRIIEQSIALFAERGYAGVSVRDVVDSVGLTPGAIYHHFVNKQALYDVAVEEAFNRVSRRLVEELSAAGGGDRDLRAGLRRYTAYMFAASPELRLVDRVIFEAEPEPSTLRRVLDDTRSALAEILERTETPQRANDIAEQMIAAIYGAAKLRPLRAALPDGARFSDPDMVADSLADLVEAALTPAPTSSSLSSQSEA